MGNILVAFLNMFFFTLSVFFFFQPGIELPFGFMSAGLVINKIYRRPSVCPNRPNQNGVVHTKVLLHQREIKLFNSTSKK